MGNKLDNHRGFSFSHQMAKVWFSQQITYDFGIDIFITTVAFAEDFKIYQACLDLKIHDNEDPPGACLF